MAIDYTAKALDLFNAGFNSKAKQKQATDYLNRAAEHAAAAFRRVLIDSGRLHSEDGVETKEHQAYWFNFDLHLWNAKRKTQLLELYPAAEEFALQMDDLAALRAQVKAAEIAPLPPKGEDERVVRVMTSIKELMERRQQQYARGLELHDLFNGLVVHANVHMVCNQFGTVFPRTYFYMFGTLTPLQVILAVAQKKAEEAEGK